MTIVQFGLPLALSMPFILASWSAFADRYRVAIGHGDETHATAATGDIDPADACHGACADLEVALCEAASAVRSVARRRWVRIELAPAASMMVPVDPRALQTALRETMLSAINAAPGGQVLITTVTLGGQPHIRITDDGPEPDRQGREITLRQTGALIALQGGSIAVEAQTGRGTTVAIRLPVPTTVEQTEGNPVQPRVMADQAA